MEKLEKHPFWLFIIIILAVVLVSNFTSDKIETFAVAGLFLGTAGFVNSLWLNQSINKNHDLEE